MRIPVEVVLVTNKVGALRPLYIIWNQYGDKAMYKIKSIRQKRRMPDGAMLYECYCDNSFHHLYHLDDRWYVDD
jgi:hypothetical protein